MTTFPHFELRGTHREVGRQHGEALREKVRGHLDLILTQAARKSKLTSEAALRVAEAFVSAVTTYSPGFMDEILGIAEGAGISAREAMLLQVRQEVANAERLGLAELECTSFAVSSPYTATGTTFAGQNADLAGGIEAYGAVLTFSVVGKPDILMLVPAGQVSYLGINSEGLSVGSNFLRSTGWRVGYPRYLLGRLALEARTLDAALDRLLAPRRASSRNIVLADRSGRMVDLEMNVDAHAILHGTGAVAHANHHLLPEMVRYDVSNAEELENSQKRHTRMTSLIEAERGRLDEERLKTILRDHANAPHAICAHRGDREVYTFASIIGDLEARRLEIAVGPPCTHPYATYALH